MFVKAIVDHLKSNGSIPHVLPIGSYNKNVNAGNAEKPYVVVYELPSAGTATSKGTLDISVMCCYPKDYQIWVDRYVLYELFNLLDNFVLEIENQGVTSKVVTSVTDNISGFITNLDDGYIGKERVVQIPYRWR